MDDYISNYTGAQKVATVASSSTTVSSSRSARDGRATTHKSRCSTASGEGSSFKEVSLCLMIITFPNTPARRSTND